MATSDAPPRRRTDRSPWNWLLILPIVLPVLTPIFNFDSPRLWGFPAFYWLQFAFILVGVATTSVVYQMTKTRTASVAASTASSDSTASSASTASSPEARDE